MSRHPGYLLLLLCSSLVTACGDDAPASPDAAVPDAAIDAPIDALTCGAPTKLCGGACLDVSTDEANCGDCGVTCAGGQACTGTCTCPTPFVPAMIEPGMFDQFQAAGAITVAISPNLESGGLNPVLIGYLATTPLDTDIDLSTVPVGEAPFVGAGYNFNLTTMTTDAQYLATAGTLRLTTRCATAAQGTLTNVTFQGVTGGLASPMVDPQGCTFTVASVAFHVQTAPCP